LLALGHHLVSASRKEVVDRMAGMAPLERPGTPEDSPPSPSRSDRTVFGSTAIEQSGDALVTVARPLFDGPTKTLEQRGAPVSRLGLAPLTAA
jgi:hypothetical protein